MLEVINAGVEFVFNSNNSFRELVAITYLVGFCAVIKIHCSDKNKGDSGLVANLRKVFIAFNALAIPALGFIKTVLL